MTRRGKPQWEGSVQALVWVGLATAALVAGTLLSTLAQSLRDLSKSAVEEIAAIRNRPARTRRIARIVDDPEGHAAASALPRIACNLIFVVAVVMWLSALRELESPTWVEAAVGVAAASILLWVFGFLLPSSIARHAAEITVYTWSGVIRFNYLIAKPITAMAHVMDEAVRRLAGRPENEALALEQELLSVVEEAKEEGTFDDTEREMIEAVVKFRNRTVAQVMTPRTEIEAMPMTNDLSVVTATIRRVGHSRIPVYEGSIDHVVGVFYVKDLMRWLAGESSRGGKTFDLKRLLRPAMFVPETKTVRDLLPELLARRVHIAIVADEYGGTAGLVTFEDIVEEIFGDIHDEYDLPDEERPEITLDAAHRAAELDARMYVEDANDALRPLGLEIPESEDYDTLAGFVTVSLGRIPASGEEFESGGVRVRVLSAEPTRVTRIKVSALHAAPAPERPPRDTPDASGPDADGVEVATSPAAGNAAGQAGR